MTASTPVEIHEFSTGIRVEGTRDNWVSLGFTGQYMNVTISEIPDPVERSIANKEFAVAEGASSERPAVIGRVVGSGELAWSVIAIVTRGRDERGRSASLYRHFLCKGDDSLPKILAWIEKQRQNGQMPIFNPFDKKEKGSPNISYTSTPIFGDDKPIFPPNFSESVPVIISQNKYNSEIELHRLAIEKAKADDQPIAWAFNVEALEQLRGFQIIQAASEKAYGILQKAKVNTHQIPGLMLDEQAFKSAIKGLMNSSTAKTEYIEAIANSLENTQITESYWREIFDSQGADKALKQGLYADQFIRLLMLRAIVIPETLPEYLVWLEKGNKQNNPYTVADDFEGQLSKSLKQLSATSPYIVTNINKGIQILLSSLLSQKVSSKVVSRLLTLDNGLWKNLVRQFMKDLDHDLNLMHQFASGEKNLPFRIVDTSWQKIWQDLKSYYLDIKFPYLAEYQPLAEVFSNLANPKISAIFYHVGYGQVPKQIFFQLKSNRWHSRIYEVEVHREVTVPELLWLTIVKLGGKPVPIQTVIPIVLLSLFLGFAIRGIIPGKLFLIQSNVANTLPGVSDKSEDKYKSDSKTEAQKAVNETKQNNTESLAVLNNLVDDKTRGAIITISQELSNASQKKLKPEQVQIQIFNFFTTKEKNALKNAIEKYQESKKEKTNPAIEKVDGEITNNSPTSKVLKCDIADYLKIENLKNDCKKINKNSG